jgi:F0F1-type ATP synthase delta subunit
MNKSRKDVLIYFELITSLKTTQEVEDFTCEIDTLMFTFLKSGMMMEKALDSISTNTAKKIMQVFTKNNLDINDKDAVAGFFETLKTLLKKFKIVKLVLAFDPTRKTIEHIHSFIENAIGVGYILDIEVSEDVLGGAIIIFNGKYYDFSLKKNIEDAFEKRKEDIASIIELTN